MMIDTNTWLFISILAANALALLLYESRRELRIVKDHIQDYEFQEMERERLQDEFNRRPVQAIISRDAVEILGQAILHYLSHQMNGTTEIQVPIFPPKDSK